ncbi:Cysteine protease [Phytophthora megakarya]|uniref:Cysteine protease n=1 Tax=Phytophthora megakarya TaxID=4795 RepID=A0A225WK09_9STRA|nr:Cysteine protease [Phytophthora megakarya]
MNEFGEGAVVHQSFLEANRDWHMEKLLHISSVCTQRVLTSSGRRGPNQSNTSATDGSQELGCKSGSLGVIPTSQPPVFQNSYDQPAGKRFGKLKDSVDSSMSMAGCVNTLVAFDRRKKTDYI